MSINIFNYTIMIVLAGYSLAWEDQREYTNHIATKLAGSISAVLAILQYSSTV